MEIRPMGVPESSKERAGSPEIEQQHLCAAWEDFIRSVQSSYGEMRRVAGPISLADGQQYEQELFIVKTFDFAWRFGVQLTNQHRSIRFECSIGQQLQPDESLRREIFVQGIERRPGSGLPEPGIHFFDQLITLYTGIVAQAAANVYQEPVCHWIGMYDDDVRWDYYASLGYTPRQEGSNYLEKSFAVACHP